MPGQTARIDRAYVTPSAPPAAPVQGTRWSASQTAKSAVFISVIGADNATLVEPIRRGRPIQIRVQMFGLPDRIVTFDPPDLTPPTPSVAVAASVAAAGIPPARAVMPTSIRANMASSPATTPRSVFSAEPIGALPDLGTEPDLVS
jgi:hypothetical protein